MREILFKAKRKSSRKNYQTWIYGYLFKDLDGTCQILFNNKNGDVEFENVIPETICQYTGLTDKNGVKIFENDIMRYREYTDDGDIDKFDVVEFKNGAFVISNDWGCETLGDILESNELNEDVDYEVIGNIFDEEVK